jgi:hypothetical protein
MKQPLLVIALLTIASAAALAPIRTTAPALLSDGDRVTWDCSTSALIMTTCVPSRDVRLTPIN